MIRSEKIARRVPRLAAAEQDAGVPPYEIALGLIGATWAWIQQTCRIDCLLSALREFADNLSSDDAARPTKSKSRCEARKHTLGELATSRKLARDPFS